MLVYDTNPSDTKYWWKELLELEMVITDEDNTENAFGSIDKVITNNIKVKYPQDYTHIRNSIVRYFRATERFEMQHFLDNAIGNYVPENTDLDIEDIKSKIKELPAKKRAPFDNQFNIIKEKVKAKFLNKIKLTPEIDLNIKGDYADNTIVAEIKDGEKYISIKSEEGYKYFKSNESQK
ncbi:nucleoid-associated protein [Myroides sp. mNGS23_01]|nr:nucleoid-associated protein [Myroides sp. mNGS23_01]WHT40951.1 nucleoid-associated protein [Myroides sp. mNGS23_01]